MMMMMMMMMIVITVVEERRSVTVPSVCLVPRSTASYHTRRLYSNTPKAALSLFTVDLLFTVFSPSKTETTINKNSASSEISDRIELH